MPEPGRYHNIELTRACFWHITACTQGQRPHVDNGEVRDSYDDSGNPKHFRVATDHRLTTVTSAQLLLSFCVKTMAAL